MKNRNLLKGLFLIALALGFGLQSLRYSIGSFARAGPGLFPLMISSMLLLLGIAAVVQSLRDERHPTNFNFRNIAIIIASLCGFALISQYVNMMLGIAFLVFVSSLAAPRYSLVRNVKIAAGLIVVAFAFQKLLGLQLPLY